MRNTILFIIGLLCALWFAFTGIYWVYWAALIIAYPFGIIAFICWKLIRSDNKKKYIVLPIVLAVGLVLSLSMLTYLLIFN